MRTLLLTNTTWQSPVHTPTSTLPDAPRASTAVARSIERSPLLVVTFTEPTSPSILTAPDAVLIVRSLPVGHCTSITELPLARTSTVPSSLCTYVPPSTASADPGAATTRTLPERRVIRSRAVASLISEKPTLSPVALDETEQTKWRERMRKLMVGTRFIE